MTKFDQTQYDEWIESCKAELSERGWTKERIEACEICERGEVYDHAAGIMWPKHTVTPWTES